MTVFLETERLVIKAPAPDHFDSWCVVHADVEAKPMSKEVLKEWLDYHIKDYKEHGFSMGSVYIKKTNEFIGRAGLFYYANSDAVTPDIEIGYILHKAYWGMGYATELAIALINWGFQHLKVAKLVALTRKENHQSQRVLEKSGMHFVKHVHSEGEDFLLYEIEKSSPPSVRNC